ncbi:hypothetical protein [Streptomyces sp. NPDC050392]|uniref:hypothetical protein n=1 Tax=Streptomyces sp. NPDC050392 TaxID=3155782 RepID=UPI0034484721
MSVRNTVAANQPDASSVKVATARFDRFGRRFPGGTAITASAEPHARGGVRFGEYTQLMTNMPQLHEPVFAGRALVLAGGAL